MEENKFPSFSSLPTVLNTKNLTGEFGENRETKLKCQINAENDLEAIYAWLDCYRHKQTTYRSYKKEAERLLLWCIYQLKKPLSSLDIDDFNNYFKFLSNPTPKNIWCTEDGAKYSRDNPKWKPFSGSLSKSAKNSSITIINSLMNFLFTARYIEFNPIHLMRNIRTATQSIQESKIKVFERILEDDEWQAIKETLVELPEGTEKQSQYKHRLKFIVAILYLLGLRIHELETHNWNSFKKHKDRWWFFVKGKRDKIGMIPVNDELLQHIVDYRISQGLESLPSQAEDSPIISSIRNNKSITSRQIHKLLKELAIKASLKFSDSDKIEKLSKFSPHWLRHLSATHQDKAGIKFKHIKDNHRHENESTTRQYIHSIDDERHDDMQKLNLGLHIEN